jgi:hypothetical protein
MNGHLTHGVEVRDSGKLGGTYSISQMLEWYARMFQVERRVS